MASGISEAICCSFVVERAARANFAPFWEKSCAVARPMPPRCSGDKDDFIGDVHVGVLRCCVLYWLIGFLWVYLGIIQCWGGEKQSQVMEDIYGF